MNRTTPCLNLSVFLSNGQFVMIVNDIDLKAHLNFKILMFVEKDVKQYCDIRKLNNAVTSQSLTVLIAFAVVSKKEDVSTVEHCEASSSHQLQLNFSFKK